MADAVIVVPCFNEERRLPQREFERFLADTPEVAFVFVDDGSTDATRERLQTLERAHPDRVRVVALPTNVGKAEAVRAGIQRAFEDDPAYVGYWDADLATPLQTILEFRRNLIERPQLLIVLGARVVLLGRKIQRRAVRHYLGRIAATAIALLLRLRIYDTQCGAKLLRATPRVRALFDEPFATSWLFDVEILARLIFAQRAAGGGPPEEVIYEAPLLEWADVAGSKIGPLDYLRAALDLARLAIRILPAGRRVAARPPQCSDRTAG